MRNLKLLQPNNLIPDNFHSPIIIAQHMGNEFISSFTLHMNANTHLDVKVPNINELFTSCAHFSNNVDILACTLTGIGDDGSKGIASFCKTDASCMAANKSSSILNERVRVKNNV